MRVLTPIALLLALMAGSVPAAAQQWTEVPLAPDTYREFPDGYRTDVVEIKVAAFTDLEYKLRMKAGQAIVYAWKAVNMAEPEALLAEFHGHTDLDAARRGTVMFYRRASGGAEQGALVAPFDGIHGWYLLNQSKQDIVIRLTVAGFYELVPGQ